jgi:hypothetical protein
MTYHHVQWGWAVIAGSVVGFGLALLVTMSLSAATLAAVPWLVAALFGLLALGLLTYATLTIDVDSDEVRVRFGVGLIRKSIPVSDIARCEVVRTPSWWGWGIHWTPSGWLYNVSGRAAVRLEMTTERPVMIGSDEAERLKAAIDARLALRAPETTA